MMGTESTQRVLMARTRRPDPRGITLADVARAAGVSKITASRVLRGGPVAGETRERVLEVVRRLGYVPNRLAGTLSSAPRSTSGKTMLASDGMITPTRFEPAEDRVPARRFGT